jgi:hypothetical protein
MSDDSFSTPIRPAPVFAACPGAPGRRLRLNSEEPAHCGKGILAGDFIKPDPVLTAAERRVYLLEELEQWLTGRICEHALGITLTDEELAPYLADGTWPAARFRVIMRSLDRDGCSVGKWVLGLCSDYLQGTESDSSVSETLREQVLGFVTTDKLPSGVTIESLWDKSSFDPLRDAPPLSDEESEVEVVEDEDEDEEDEDEDEEDEDEDEEEEEVEVDIIHRAGPSLDDKINAFLTTEYPVPGWMLVMIGSILTTYMWIAVASC